MTCRKKPNSAPGWLSRFVYRAIVYLGRRLRREHFDLCIYKTDRIGDFVLCISVIRLLIEEYGSEKKCVLVVNELTKPIAEYFFPEVKVMAVPNVDVHTLRHILPGTFSMLRTAGRIDASELVVLRHQLTAYHALVLSIISSRRAYASAYTSQRYQGLKMWDDLVFSLIDKQLSDSDGQLPGELHLHRDILSFLLQRHIAPAEILPCVKDMTCNAENGDTLLIAPFSTSSLKEYPQDRLLDVINALTRWYHGRIVLVSSKSDAGRLEMIRNETLRRNSSVNIEVECSLDILSYIKYVFASTAILTMDSATAHIATMADLPTVVLLGGGHYGRFGPWHRSHRQIWLNHPCEYQGCDWVCRFERGLCVSEISVDAVDQALSQVWRHRGE